MKIKNSKNDVKTEGVGNMSKGSKNLLKSGFVVLAGIILIFSSFVVNAGPVWVEDNTGEFSIYDRSIHGVVVDPEGNPIPAVKVKINGTSNEVYTDVNGEYYLINAPVGEIPVVFSKEGYVINTRLVPVSNNTESYYGVILVPKTTGVPIGPAGGTIYGDGGVILSVPPGALNETVNITITPIPPEAFPETMGQEYLMVLNGLALGPSNLQFNKPVNVTVPFSYLGDEIVKDAINSTTITFSYFDPESLTWIEGSNATLNADNTSATIQLNHFSVIRTTTFWYKWYISITDEGYQMDKDPTYEGNIRDEIILDEAFAKIKDNPEQLVMKPYERTDDIDVTWR